MTAEDVSAAVAQSNALLPSGEFITATFDANVYTNAVPERVQRIGDALVKQVGGAPVFIRDVARVEDGGAAPTQTVCVNGENAVYLNVLRVPGGNTLAIVDAVKRRSRGLKDLPQGMVVKPVFDESTFVQHVLLGAQARGRAGARPHLARHPALPAERPRDADRRRRNPALLRDHAHRPLRHRADAERLHARAG